MKNFEMTKRATRLREDRVRNRNFNSESSINNVVEPNNSSCNPSENIKNLFHKAVEEWKAQYDSEIVALKMELTLYIPRYFYILFVLGGGKFAPHI